jgi:hypothetical protein
MMTTNENFKKNQNSCVLNKAASQCQLAVRPGLLSLINNLSKTPAFQDMLIACPLINLALEQRMNLHQNVGRHRLHAQTVNLQQGVPHF